jgi:hypothetical protein
MVLSCRSFPDDLFGVFVIAKRNEFGVSQMVGTSPLQKCYLSHGLGLQPQCRMPDYAELGCCECCHYCVQRHFVRHNPREYASNGIVPHLVASVNASRLFFRIADYSSITRRLTSLDRSESEDDP